MNYFLPSPPPLPCLPFAGPSPPPFSLSLSLSFLLHKPTGDAQNQVTAPHALLWPPMPPQGGKKTLQIACLLLPSLPLPSFLPSSLPVFHFVCRHTCMCVCLRLLRYCSYWLSPHLRFVVVGRGNCCGNNATSQYCVGI